MCFHVLMDQHKITVLYLACLAYLAYLAYLARMACIACMACMAYLALPARLLLSVSSCSDFVLSH